MERLGKRGREVVCGSWVTDREGRKLWPREGEVVVGGFCGMGGS